MSDWYSLSDGEVLSNLGIRMRLARIERNLTQEMLAEHSGLSRTTVRDIENGKSVNLASFIALLRSLERLERLDNLLPGPDQSPVMSKLYQERKRVRLNKS